MGGVSGSSGVGDVGRREGRQIEYVARLVVGARVQLIDDRIARRVLRQSGRLTLHQRTDHQLAVGRQTCPH